MQEDFNGYNRDFDYDTIYQTKRDIAIISKELTDLKINLSSHFAKEEFRDNQLNKILIAIEGNGKPGILSDIRTLFGYAKFVAGAAAAVGIIWSVVVFVVPMLIK